MILHPEITVNIRRVRVQKSLRLLGNGMCSHELVMPAPDIANEANFVVYTFSVNMTRSE